MITITLETEICMNISGFQGASFLDREDLVRNFPQTSARRIIKWRTFQVVVVWENVNKN